MATLFRPTFIFALVVAGFTLCLAAGEDTYGLSLVQARASVVHAEAEKKGDQYPADMPYGYGAHALDDSVKACKKQGWGCHDNWNPCCSGLVCDKSPQYHQDNNGNNQGQCQPQAESGGSAEAVDANVSVEQSHRLELSRHAWVNVDAYKYLMLDTNSDPAHKLLFCMVPKNACTEFLSLIMRIDGFEDHHWNPTHYGDPQAMVHGNEKRESLFLLQRSKGDEAKRKAMFESRMDGTDGAGYQRAVFLRDPVHRLLSAYRSKVQTGMYDQPDKGYPIALPRTLDFESLVGHLEEHGVTAVNIDPHIMAQSSLCGLSETLPYMTFVGDFDNLNEDARRLVTLVGGPEFASEMLDNGWGPNKTQSLFGVPRTVREAGAKRGYMPVMTDEDIAGISTVNLLEIEGGRHSSYYSNTHLEQEFVKRVASKLERDNPELVARIQKLYAKDYELIDKYLPGKRAARL